MEGVCPMKRLIYLMLALVLVVCAAGSASATETEPPSEAAPSSTEEKVEFPSETTPAESGETEAPPTETSQTEPAPTEETGTPSGTEAPPEMITEPPASTEPPETAAPQPKETETIPVPATEETAAQTTAQTVTEETTVETTTEPTVTETTEMVTTSEETVTETTVPPTTEPTGPFPGGGGFWLWICGGLVVLGLGLLVLGTHRTKRRKGHGVPLRLEVLAGDVRSKNALLYLKDTLWIGNSRQCDIQVRGKHIPAQAARIYTQDCFLFVESLSEDVRVRVGGMRIYAPNLLRSGDEITIEGCKFRLLF